jgi:hypothetical protein
MSHKSPVLREKVKNLDLKDVLDESYRGVRKPLNHEDMPVLLNPCFLYQDQAELPPSKRELKNKGHKTSKYSSRSKTTIVAASLHKYEEYFSSDRSDENFTRMAKTRNHVLGSPVFNKTFGAFGKSHETKIDQRMSFKVSPYRHRTSRTQRRY